MTELQNPPTRYGKHSVDLAWRFAAAGGFAVVMTGGAAIAVSAQDGQGPSVLAAVSMFSAAVAPQQGSDKATLAAPSFDGPVSSTDLPFGASPPADRMPSASIKRASISQPPIVRPEPLVIPAPAVVPPVSAAQGEAAPDKSGIETVAWAVPFVVPMPSGPMLSAAEQAASATVLLTLRGSNTVGLELAPKLAQAYLTFNGDANVSIVRSKDNTDDAMIVGSRAGKTEAIFVSARGSGFAAKGLAAHSETTPTDIGMSSRRMTTAEHGSLASKGDMFSPNSEHVLALDGVAVIVHPSNPVGALSVQQIRDVFSGAIVDWGDKRLGGTPGPIHLYARDNNSGTFDTFNALVLRGSKLQADAKRFEDSELLSASVGKDPAGIGFIGLPYVSTNKALAVSENGTTPIRPNRLTVATEDYALARRLFLYTAPDNANPEIRRFVEFSLSQAGQTIVENVGFVSLSLRKEAVKPALGAPPDYAAMIRNAERLSTDFRFRFNSVELDNRGARDTTRLADYLAGQHIEPRRVVLAGFGDNIGQPQAIRTVSESRAKAVAEALRRDGVVVGQTVGFGAQMPVADNATEEGRDKNRRVEVYVRP